MDRAPAVMTVAAMRTPRAAAVAGLAFRSCSRRRSCCGSGRCLRARSDAGHVGGGRRQAPCRVGQPPPAAVRRHRVPVVHRGAARPHRAGRGPLLRHRLPRQRAAVHRHVLRVRRDGGRPGQHRGRRRLGGRLGSVWPFGRRSVAGLATVYGLRMAAVFTISTTTLAARLRLVPRWLAVLGYATAGILLSAAASCGGWSWSSPAGCSSSASTSSSSTFDRGSAATDDDGGRRVVSRRRLRHHRHRGDGSPRCATQFDDVEVTVDHGVTPAAGRQPRPVGAARRPPPGRRARPRAARRPTGIDAPP